MRTTARTSAKPDGHGQGNSSGRIGIERRSGTRPKILEGWRKEQRHDHRQSARAASAAPRARIDVWLTHTDSFFKAKSCFKILTKDDWAAVWRLRDPSDRLSTMAARVLLRLGLSRAVNRLVAPPDWRFAKSNSGKPIVAPTFPGIHFSVSHIDRLAVVAVSSRLQVGIDVESVDENINEGVVADFCHSNEQMLLGGLTPERKRREFIRLWTLKEAYTKMTGTGHSMDFGAIGFGLDPVTLGSHVSGRDFFTQFETLFVTAFPSLYHLALAIRHPGTRALATEIQIISLTDSEEKTGAFAAPICV